jgi:hypothetical protein
MGDAAGLERAAGAAGAGPGILVAALGMLAMLSLEYQARFERGFSLDATLAGRYTIEGLRRSWMPEARPAVPNSGPAIASCHVGQAIDPQHH